MPQPPGVNYDVAAIREEAQRLYNLAQSDRERITTAVSSDYVASSARSRQRLAAVRGWS